MNEWWENHPNIEALKEIDRRIAESYIEASEEEM